MEGRYRSADDRFTIEGGGAGRWFVTDEAHLDELGLARTLGPFATLDDAKRAADEQREAASEPSPLAARLAAAKPPLAAEPAHAARRPRAGPRRSGAAEPEPEGAGANAAATKPGRPVARTWLDELADEDRGRAAGARRLIAALEELGVADADALVRRDILGRQPAIATRLVGRSLAAAIAAALDPKALQRDVQVAAPPAARVVSDADGEAVTAYAAFVAGRVLAATLAVLTSSERAEGANRALPGWRLVERPAPGEDDAVPRRLIVGVGDVAEG